MSGAEFQHSGGDGLQAILDSAREFGLAEDEVWQAVHESSSPAGSETTMAQFVDRLCAVLAQRILTKERQADPHGRP